MPNLTYPSDSETGRIIGVGDFVLYGDRVGVVASVSEISLLLSFDGKLDPRPVDPAKVTLITAYRDLFENGRKFRVVVAGLKVSGMKPVAPYTQQGWSEQLPIGTVLTCDGTSMTFGDGVPALKWRDAHGSFICNDALIEPHMPGMWSGMYPIPGTMEPIEFPGLFAAIQVTLR